MFILPCEKTDHLKGALPKNLTFALGLFKLNIATLTAEEVFNKLQKENGCLEDCA